MPRDISVKYSSNAGNDIYTLSGHAIDDKVTVTSDATISTDGVLDFNDANKNEKTTITVTDSAGTDQYTKTLAEIKAQTSYGGNLSRKRRRRRRRRSSASKRHL